MFSAVNTATTPGAASAAAVSIRTIRACGCSLRRKAMCNAAVRLAIGAILASPGQKPRVLGALDRAPTCRGTQHVAGCASLSLLITLVSLAQGSATAGLMTTDDGRSGTLDPPHLFERLQQRLHIPSVARRVYGIEALPEADRIRSQQELTVAVEIDQRAEQTWRVARQRHRTTLASPKRIILAIHGFDRVTEIPIRAEITGGFRARRLRGIDPPWREPGSSLRKRLVAAAMVGWKWNSRRCRYRQPKVRRRQAGQQNVSSATISGFIAFASGPQRSSHGPTTEG